MVAIPAPTHAREEWEEADFDLPEGDVIRPPSDADFDKDDEEDWDIEMDLGKTGGAKVTSIMQGLAMRRSPPRGTMVTIRPTLSTLSEPLSPDEAEEDEGISTIKISALPTTTTAQKPSETITVLEDDMEADFALPADLTQLSLRPLSLHHRGSKASLEWGDRDHTSSSASSSDAYSTLGFHASKDSTSASLPGTDDDCDDEEDNDLDGLVIPTGLFESDQGRKHLTKILDLKKKTPKIEERVKMASPDPEDDFEIGLVINGDDDLSPSKFAQTQQTKRSGTMTARSNSMPARTSTSSTLRPPSRLKTDRPKTPVTTTSGSGSSSRVSSRISTSPPLRPSLSRRTQTFQPLPSSQHGPIPSSFIAPKQGIIRSQKSHGVLKSPSPPNSRKLNRKASLSSLLETSSAQESSAPESSSSQQPKGYSATTASSRARVHTNSASRMHSIDQVPPTRPSTPSSNPAALRLTMPTNLSRVKSRPSISNIFPGAPPLPTVPKDVANQGRPSSRASTSSVSAPAKSIRRTKRRVFGDGTELDGFEDLPTDRDKEAQFRKQPKGNQNKIPSGSVNQAKNEIETGKNTIRRKRELSEHSLQPSASSLSLRHKYSRLEGLSKNENPQKRRPSSSSTTATRRKPTLIRHLGGAGAPKIVGEMRWNPQTLRWEGNDQALRDFDSASTRPALITHLTGSSMGSPHGSFGSSARVVGNMVFDPVRMCWMSTLAPEDEEPDVFADLADDEEDGDWESKGGTIRASQQALREACGHIESSRKTPSPAPSTRSRSQSQSDSDHNSRASLVFDVEDNFIELCRSAEARHRTEMRGWMLGRNDSRSSYNEPNRSYLYEIRTLATRQY